uniref:Replicase n=1 Tax=Lhasa Rhabd tick virus 1 TaxID=2972334 RepID=A0A9E8AAP2_9RHAB|nr:MAG: RNA-dependent RNA polymerase [Lhasa Rhabd tick virus 1]
MDRYLWSAALLEQEEGLSGDSGRRYQLFPSTHLDSALRSEPYDAALCEGKTVPKRYQQEAKEGASLRRSGLLGLSTRDPPKALISVLHALGSNYECLPKLFSLRSYLSTGLLNSRVQHEALGLLPGIQAPVGQVADDLMLQVEPEWRVRNLCNLLAAESAKKIQRSPRPHPLLGLSNVDGFLEIRMGHLFILLGEKMTLFILGADQYLLSRDSLLLLSDLATQRFILKYACLLAEVSHSPVYPAYPTVARFIEIGDNLILQLGNLGFNVLKNVEGLIMGVLLHTTEENILDSETFVSSVKEDMLQEVRDSSDSERQGERCVNLISEMTALLYQTSYNPHHLSQLFGLYRIWGHPVVDVLGGLQQLKDLSTGFKSYDPMTAAAVGWKFKEVLCSSYRKRHGCWPQLYLEKLPTSSFLHETITNNWTLEIGNPRYQMSDWELVEGRKTFECESSFNMSTLISDKALSLDRDQVVQMIKTHKHIGFSTDRRVLIKWLESDMVSAKEFLETIDKQGIPLNCLIIGVTPKERELKVKARMFSLMSLLVRMYIVITESLIADNILPYFPQITMVDDLLTLLKKIYTSTKDLGPLLQRIVEIVTNIDFEKWNSNERKEANDPVFIFLDQLFGFQRIFQLTHQIFYESTVYLADNSILPEIHGDELVDGPTVWRRHAGGFEGLRQKGWTLHTVCALLLAADKNGLKAKIMGQGDNQVIIVSLPGQQSHETIEDALDRIRRTYEQFKQDLYRVFEDLSLPIKKSETWSSSTIFAYGKMLIRSGCPLSMSLKKICRCFPYSNEGFPSLDTSVSTIFANCQAGAMTDLTPEISFIVASSEVGYCVRSHLEYSIALKQGLKTVSVLRIPVHGGTRPAELISSEQDKLISLLLLFPGSLGGLPIMFLCDYAVRGFPDPLSKDISVLMKLCAVVPRSWTPLLAAWMIPEIPDEIKVQDFLESPLSIPLVSGPTIEGIVKGECQKFLESADWIKNEYFRTFFTIASEDCEEYISYLLSFRPMWPRLISDIYDATLWGYARGVVGRVNHTATIQSLAMRRSSSSTVARIARSERKRWTRLLTALCREEHRGIPACGANHARALRRRWGLGTLHGVTVPHPLEIFRPYTVGESVCEGCLSRPGYILVKIDERVRGMSVSETAMTLGPGVPYIGSYTKEKIQPGLDQTIKNPDPLSLRAIKIQRVIGWFVPSDSTLAETCREVLRSITDLDPRILETQYATGTGSGEHRYQDVFTKHGGFHGGLYTPATYMHVSTNSLSQYSKGGKNVTLHFQASMCWSQTVAIHRMINGLTADRRSQPIHMHEVCPHCIIEVEDCLDPEPLEHRASPISLPNNPLCWIPRSSVQLSSLHVPRSSPMLSREMILKETEQIGYMMLGLRLAEAVLSRELGVQDLSGPSEIFPMVWTLRVNPCQLLRLVGCLLIAGAMFTKIGEDSGRRGSGLQGLIESCTRMILEARTSSWEPLVSLWTFPEVRARIYSEYPIADPPHSAPYTIGAISRAIEDLFGHLLQTVGERDLQQWNSLIFSLPSSRRGLSTGWLKLTSQILCAPESEGSRLTALWHIKKAISLLGPLEDYICTDPYMTLSTCLLDQSDMSLMTVQLLESGLAQQREPLPICNASLDFIMKRMPSVPNTHGACDPCVPNELLRGLPKAGRVICSVLEWDGPPLTMLVEGESYVSRASSYAKHCMRPVANITTAHYKYLDILRYLSLTEIDTAAVLGDGTGGVTALLMRIFPGAKVYYNTLVDIKGVIPHSVPSFTPPALDMLSGAQDNLLQFPRSLEVETDITSPTFPSTVASLLENSVSIVLCDAEGGGWDKPGKGARLSHSICSICVKTGCEACVFKTYASNLSLTEAQLQLFSSVYLDVKVYKSDFSGEGSSEVFILCNGLRHDATVPLRPEEGEAGTYVSGKQLHPTTKLRLGIGIKRALDMSSVIDMTAGNAYTRLLCHGMGRSLLTRRLRFMTFGALETMETACGVISRISVIITAARRSYAPVDVGVRFTKHRTLPSFLSEGLQMRLIFSYIAALCPGRLDENGLRSLETQLQRTKMIVYRTQSGSWGYGLVVKDATMPRGVREHDNNWVRSPRYGKVFFQCIGALMFQREDMPCYILPQLSLEKLRLQLPGHLVPSGYELRKRITGPNKEVSLEEVLVPSY